MPLFRMVFLSSLEVQLLPDAAKYFVLLLSALSTLNLFSGHLLYPTDTSVTNCQYFDVILIGASSEGCVVANRLSEVQNVSVLHIGADDDPKIDVLIPSFDPLIAFSKEKWKYFSEDNEYSAQLHKERRQHYGIGKLIGGICGTNYMFYVKDQKQDYENWVKAGATGWDWDTVLYDLKKRERMTSEPILHRPSAKLHYRSGCFGVSRPDWGNKSNRYLEAFIENSCRLLVNSNDVNFLQYSQLSFTIDPPYRQNTALAFLGSAKNRKNLFVLKKILRKENNC